MGWPQWHYSWLHSDRHPEMVSRGVNYYFIVVGFLVVAVSAWILPLLHLLFASVWWEASDAVLPLGLAAIGTGAYSLFAVGIHGHEADAAAARAGRRGGRPRDRA